VQAPKNVTARREQQPQRTEQAAPVTPQDQNTIANIADASAEFEQMDELSIANDEEPVSFDKLSTDELEAVLKTLESEPLSIE
jgi:hypothetical protein